MPTQHSRTKFIEALEPRRLLAAQLFADLNPAGLAPAHELSFGNRVMFAGQDPILGNEPFISDGTAKGTKLIKDINPGSADSSPVPLFTTDKAAYFTATDASGGALYRTDGTAAHTVKLVEGSIDQTATGGFGSFAQVGDSVYFTYRTSTPLGVFATVYRDGPEGLKIVRQSGNDFGVPRDLTGIGSTLYMAVDTPAGPQLWKSDGTTNGTVPITFHASILTEFAVYNDELYFAARTGAGQGLWKLKHGTKPVFLKPAYALIVLDQIRNSGALWLQIWNSNSEPRQVWRLNSTGLTQVTDFAAGAGPSRTDWLDTDTTGMTFVANGREIWFCGINDPLATLLGTLPKPISTGGASSINPMFNDGDFVYARVTNSNAAVLWRYDIADKQLQRLGKVPRNATMALAGHNVVFAEPDATGYNELWSAGDTGTAQEQLTDVMGGEMDSNTSGLTQLNNGLLFTTTGGYIDRLTSVWFTDGSSAPVLVKTIPTATFNTGYFPPMRTFVTAGGYALLSVYNSPNVESYDLWRTDGTAAGTKLLRAGLGNIRFLGQLGSKTILAWSDFDEKSQREVEQIWATDGTSAGTVPLATLKIRFEDSSPTGTIFNGKLYFVVGGDLYKTDGTPGGTSAASVLPPPTDFAVDEVDDLMVRNNRLLLAGSENDDLTAAGLPTAWSLSPGASKATQLIQEPRGWAYPDKIHLVHFAGSSKTLMTVGTSVYEVPASPTTDQQLATTHVPGQFQQFIGFVNGIYYASTYLLKEGNDAIYALDSSLASPKLVGSIGSDTDLQHSIVSNGSLIYFDRFTGAIQRITGTSQSTVGQVPINDYPVSGYDEDPNEEPHIYLTVVGKYVFFLGADSTHGVELWRYAP